MDPLATISTRRTPQTQRAPGPAGERQAKNNAGGYAFVVSDEVRVHRFLTIGTTGGTYYSGEAKLTRDNADVILAAARARASWLVEQVVAVSTAGRAPKQNPAIFALAAAAALGDDAGRRAALDAVPLVCRTGSTLFTFAGYVEQFRGWGRGLRRAIGAWYLDKPVDQLAYQAVKYRQRDGWTHRDLLRLAHPATNDEARSEVFSFITRGQSAIAGADVTPIIGGYQQAQWATEPKRWAELVRSYGLSWEMLPDAALGHAEVWRAMIAKGIPQTALMRQLPRLTRLGVLDGDTRRTVVAQLQDGDRLKKARVHPVNVLLAQRTYASGRSVRGESTWTPDRRIVDALDAAFYAAFSAVEPTGKRTLLALDVSGSMGSLAGGLPITCREVCAALALVTMAVEDDVEVVGFTAPGGQRGWNWRSAAELTPLSLSPRQRLDDAVRSIADLPFGGTDCSLPMTWATSQRKAFDTMVVFTDNETYAGAAHPHQALQIYRQRMGLDTRLAVVALTATEFSIADPADPGMLDVAGFDSAVPNLIADFSRGAI